LGTEHSPSTWIILSGNLSARYVMLSSKAADFLGVTHSNGAIFTRNTSYPTQFVLCFLHHRGCQDFAIMQLLFSPIML